MEMVKISELRLNPVSTPLGAKANKAISVWPATGLGLVTIIRLLPNGTLKHLGA